MDYFYDGQIRKYVTQFMRFFIGFKYRSNDGTEKHFPVTYGDMTRQVAAIINDNSENKMLSVPKIACYITGLELDRSRLSDASFVSKINIRERDYEFEDGQPVYGRTQGGTYTIERLMPTPYILKMKADLWTSSTDQKLQILEQISIFFSPSFEIQTTDNYVDWTSLSVVYLENINFSSRTIPAGADSEIDICSLEFSMPIYISPPAKVKKLGVVHNIIMNIFTDNGDINNLENLTLTKDGVSRLYHTATGYGVLLLKSENGQENDYDVSIIDATEAVLDLKLDGAVKVGQRLDWNNVIPLYGNYKPGLSKIFFLQPNGRELRGTFTINAVDSSYLTVTVEDKPSNSIIASIYRNPGSLGTIDAVVNPQNFNPIKIFGSTAIDIPVGTRYLVLEGINTGIRKSIILENKEQLFDTEILFDNVKNHRLFIDGVFIPSTAERRPDTAKGNYIIKSSNIVSIGSKVTWEVGVNQDGPDAWKNLDGSDPVIAENSIIEWTGNRWTTVLDSDVEDIIYVTNLKTGIQYKLENGQWLKSFEGEYSAGTWRFDLNP